MGGALCPPNTGDIPPGHCASSDHFSDLFRFVSFFSPDFSLFEKKPRNVSKRERISAKQPEKSLEGIKKTLQILFKRLFLYP